MSNINKNENDKIINKKENINNTIENIINSNTNEIDSDYEYKIVVLGTAGATLEKVKKTPNNHTNKKN